MLDSSKRTNKESSARFWDQRLMFWRVRVEKRKDRRVGPTKGREARTDRSPRARLVKPSSLIHNTDSDPKSGTRTVWMGEALYEWR